MKNFIKPVFGIALVALFSTPALAVPVSWTDWTSSSDSFSATGQLLVGSTTVGVNYSGTGAHFFVQTGSGPNYWSQGTPAPYTSGSIDNVPPAAELVALWEGGTVTVSFTQAIENPYIAMNSWNGNTVDFGVPITIDSVGAGFWGVGSATLNGGGTGFFGNGEFHGVVALTGSFNSISFTHVTEGWHGFTIGVAGLAAPTQNGNDVPEPAPLALLGLGLLGLGLLRKRHG